MARKKPKESLNTKTEGLKQKSQEKPSVEQAIETAVEPVNNKLTEQTPVTLSQVLAWKQAGNYEVLEYHIRKGNIELLPTPDALRLLNTSIEQKHIHQALQGLLKAFQPLLQKEEELKVYIDPDSKWKLNVGRLMEEAMSALMPLQKGEVPLIALLKSCVDTEVLKQMPLQELSTILQKEEFHLQPFIDLAIKLGLAPEQTTTEDERK